jgi:Fe-S cluster biosynthesis and repair protein YggX
MISTCCSKHVEAWNKYIKKECVKLVINQNYVKMHGQQNIKIITQIYMQIIMFRKTNVSF